MTLALKNNAAATVNYSFQRPGANSNQTVYYGPAHTFDEKDVVTLGFTHKAPNSSGFVGQSRATLNYTVTSEVNATTGSVADSYGDITIRLATGASDTVRLEILARLAEAIALEIAGTTKLASSGHLQY